MSDMSRRSFLVALAAATSLAVAACSNGGESAQSAGSSTSGSANGGDAGDRAGGEHVIGVAVYNVADNEVLMFREYLVDYVAKVCFEDVRFVYSDSITSEDELIAFIDEVAAMGGEGLMSFYNIDLQAEVERCASHGMYHIVASGTVSEEDFAKVENNPFFLGVIGPMVQMEYNAGANMVSSFIAKKAGDRYFIMSGGAGVGNEMHYQRTLGMLDTLQSSYGVDLGDTKTVAATTEPLTIQKDQLSVTISPGYISRPEMRESVVESFGNGADFDIVLSTISVDSIRDLLNKAKVKIAMVDCYSQNNQLLFAEGRLNYLVGKYGSLVGPSFAALYNAVTGYADVFRDNGKAFKISQNFWASDSEADFNEKYEFASNITQPAYNFEDLYSICRAFTPDATFDDLRKLAEACSYEDAKRRRSSN